MSDTAAVVGAGVLGRLLALELFQAGWRVTLFDEGNPAGIGTASYAAAGMLCPYCEVEENEEAIGRLGIASLEIWPRYLEKLPQPVFFQRSGTLAVAHARDREELGHLALRAAARYPGAVEVLEREALRKLEPELDPSFSDALFFPREGQIENRELLIALYEALRRNDVALRFGERVEVRPRRVVTNAGEEKFTWVIDCRGIGAADSIADLRPVRGEILRVHAPEVRLFRPIRLRHPRYPVYIVPRPKDRYVIGATSIESGDSGPVTVRSVLELLSSAFSVHSGFGEARLLETTAACRPAFPDNRPHARFRPGLLQVNGLFRNGYLVAPRVVELTAEFLARGRAPEDDALPFEEIER